jgi:hypothetical protein
VTGGRGACQLARFRVQPSGIAVIGSSETTILDADLEPGVRFFNPQLADGLIEVSPELLVHTVSRYPQTDLVFLEPGQERGESVYVVRGEIEAMTILPGGEGALVLSRGAGKTLHWVPRSGEPRELRKLATWDVPRSGAPGTGPVGSSGIAWLQPFDALGPGDVASARLMVAADFQELAQGNVRFSGIDGYWRGHRLWRDRDLAVPFTPEAHHLDLSIVRLRAGQDAIVAGRLNLSAFGTLLPQELEADRGIFIGSLLSRRETTLVTFRFPRLAEFPQ